MTFSLKSCRKSETDELISGVPIEILCTPEFTYFREGTAAVDQYVSSLNYKRVLNLCTLWWPLDENLMWQYRNCINVFPLTNMSNRAACKCFNWGNLLCSTSTNWNKNFKISLQYLKNQIKVHFSNLSKPFLISEKYKKYQFHLKSLTVPLCTSKSN